MAVVAAILTSGLRIMPHSGGRVGKGIYFASENNKSAGYGEVPSAQAWAAMGRWQRLQAGSALTRPWGWAPRPGRWSGEERVHEGSSCGKGPQWSLVTHKFLSRGVFTGGEGGPQPG